MLRVARFDSRPAIIDSTIPSRCLPPRRIGWKVGEVNRGYTSIDDLATSTEVARDNFLPTRFAWKPTDISFFSIVHIENVHYRYAAFEKQLFR